MTMSGTSRRSPFPNLDPEDYRTVQYFHLFPNLLLSILPDYVITHTVWPVDTSQSRVVCEWFFFPASMAEEEFDPNDADPALDWASASRTWTAVSAWKDRHRG